MGDRQTSTRHPHPRIRRCTHQAPRETIPPTPPTTPTPPTQTQTETPQTRSVAAPDTVVYSNPIGRRISVSAGAAAATVVAALEVATGAALDPALAGAGAGDALGANASLADPNENNQRCGDIVRAFDSLRRVERLPSPDYPRTGAEQAHASSSASNSE